ncbi:uncharacterized protein PHALS_14872 [Plasmopara halstedii]|uniref:Uncharacterized protein n=1 Tax=Plasmopara halstedii TaxID=4781 RepID=A0A0P1A7I2_PLAHL|nr:uncharacterized protein PHALS_14872 [Plasmopara halstedii]CEG36389.1 hypothetical protein PHALS_14872 [Plasmopara halstedii]|eukprot:XP_024572758.1 hypothetical protein PHALS_14872 [Plasmopara halstedii]
MAPSITDIHAGTVLRFLEHCLQSFCPSCCKVVGFSGVFQHEVDQTRLRQVANSRAGGGHLLGQHRNIG